MAHRYSSLSEDWGGLGSSHGEHSAYTSHADERSRIPPTAQQILVGGPNTDHYPSREVAGNIATHSYLAIDTAESWKHDLPPTTFDGTGAYSLSDYSEVTNGSSTLSPLGPSSIQSVIQHNSGWVDGPVDQTSALWPNDNQQLDFGTSLDQTPIPLFTFGAEDAPYYPGSRLDRPGPSHTTTGYLQTVGQSTPSVIKYDETSYHDPQHSKAATIADSLHSGTVTSEGRRSARSYKKHTSVNSQSGITTCSQCGQEFSGRYQRGNWARHVRQQHSEKEAQISQDCVCRVCGQLFKRQDARRKHEWKKHGLEDTKPLPRRPLARDSSSHAGTYDTPSEEGTLTCHPTVNVQKVGEALYRVPDSSHRAHDKFATARELLDNQQFNNFCSAILTRGKLIVGQLRYERSNLHGTFNQELRDLSKQLLRRQRDSFKSDLDAEGNLADAQSSAKSHHGGDTSSRLMVGNAPNRRRASTASSRFNPYPRRSSKKSEEDPLLAILGPFIQQDDQFLDCPIHKWHLMHGNDSPCNGCGKPYMNGVRQHLLPTYSQQHRGKILFMQRCDNCKEDFVDQNDWNRGRHGNGNCVARSQPRGNNLMCWARLFLKIYPEEHSIPSPYRNDSRLLPNELVVRLRHELSLIRSTSAGEESSQQAQHEAETPNNVASFQWFEAELERRATIDTLVERCSTLLAQLLAYRFDQAANEHVDIQEVTHVYHSRLEQLRQQELPRLTQSHRASDYTPQYTSSSLAMSHQAHAPIIGGAADFTMPIYDSIPVNSALHVPQSETGTLPSSQDYQTGEHDVDFGFPSLLASSSQTSYDFGTSTHMEMSHASGAQINIKDEDINLEFTPPGHNQEQWPLIYNTYLDVPGSSHIPQPHFNAQMFSDIDQTLESPSESHYAMSNFAPDDMSGFRNVD